MDSQKGAGEEDQRGDAQQDGEANHSILSLGADEIEVEQKIREKSGGL